MADAKTRTDFVTEQEYIAYLKRYELWQESLLDPTNDKNKPKLVAHVYTLGISIPDLRAGYRINVQLTVDMSGYCQITHFNWFGIQSSTGRPVDLTDVIQKRAYLAHNEVRDWLIEWELLRWLPIGPEDAELFVTDKFCELTGHKQTDEYFKR